jgi:hypothetical protein
MSPTRPRIGVKIAADSRLAVNTQVTVFCEVCSSAWIVDSTGAMSDWTIAKDATPVARPRNVAPGGGGATGCQLHLSSFR